MIASNVFCVPHVVVKYVCSVGKRATIMPMNSNWSNPVKIYIYIYIYNACIFT